MTRHNTRMALVVTGVLATVLTTALDLQSVSAEGGARRDAVRQEQVVKDSIKHATAAGGTQQTRSSRQACDTCRSLAAAGDERREGPALGRCDYQSKTGD
jgi:hypothetical protein